MTLPKRLRRVVLAVSILFALAFDAIVRWFACDYPSKYTDNRADLSDDGWVDFEATADDQIEYQPTEDTLADAADSTHEYNVHVERRVEIEPDRLEEWVDANYDAEDHVYVRTKHGAIVLSRGEPIGYECPVCGRNTSLIQMTGGEREWIHIDEDRSCTLEVTDGE